MEKVREVKKEGGKGKNEGKRRGKGKLIQGKKLLTVHRTLTPKNVKPTVNFYYIAISGGTTTLYYLLGGG